MDPYLVLRRAWNCRRKRWMVPNPEGVTPQGVVIRENIMKIMPINKTYCRMSKTATYIEYDSLTKRIWRKCLFSTCDDHEDDYIADWENFEDFITPSEWSTRRKIKFQDILDAMKRDKILPDIIVHGVIDKPSSESEKDWFANPIMKRDIFTPVHFTITNTDDKCTTCHGEWNWVFDVRKMRIMKECRRIIRTDMAHDMYHMRHYIDLPVDQTLDAWVVEYNENEDRLVTFNWERHIVNRVNDRLIALSWVLHRVISSRYKLFGAECEIYVLAMKVAIPCPSPDCPGSLQFSLHARKNIVARTCSNGSCDHRKWVRRTSFPTIADFIEGALGCVF